MSKRATRQSRSPDQLYPNLSGLQHEDSDHPIEENEDSTDSPDLNSNDSPQQHSSKYTRPEIHSKRDPSPFKIPRTLNKSVPSQLISDDSSTDSISGWDEHRSRFAQRQRADYTDDREQFWKNHYFVACLILLCGVLIAVLILSLSEKPQENPSRERNAFEVFQKEASLWKVQFSNQHSKLWTSLRVSIKTVLNSSQPREPATILLAATAAARATAACLAKKIASSASVAFGHSADNFLSVISESYQSSDPAEIREKIDISLRLHLKDDNVAVLYDIETLPGDSSLLLHALCDNDHAPFKNSVILLTTTVDELQVGKDYGKCEISVRDQLEHVLNEKGVVDDKSSALLSRIANTVLCVTTEAELKSC